MNHGGRIVEDMRRLIALFADCCSDRSTLDELYQMLEDHGRWTKAHALFDRIRKKNLAAERGENEVLSAQYGFEEICAKTIYNLSYSSAPFDADSPYWLVPTAFALARALKIDASRLLDIVAA